MAPIIGTALKFAAPLLLGLFGGNKTKNDATKRTQGMRMETLGPQIMRMMQEQQARQQQQYGQQMQRYQQADPLRDAVMRLAMSLVPKR